MIPKVFTRLHKRSLFKLISHCSKGWCDCHQTRMTPIVSVVTDGPTELPIPECQPLAPKWVLWVVLQPGNPISSSSWTFCRMLETMGPSIAKAGLSNYFGWRAA